PSRRPPLAVGALSHTPRRVAATGMPCDGAIVTATRPRGSAAEHVARPVRRTLRIWRHAQDEPVVHVTRRADEVATHLARTAVALTVVTGRCGLGRRHADPCGAAARAVHGAEPAVATYAPLRAADRRARRRRGARRRGRRRGRGNRRLRAVRDATVHRAEARQRP